jgi:eukaryotic-like serine/threonine-protein kinase
MKHQGIAPEGVDCTKDIMRETAETRPLMTPQRFQEIRAAFETALAQSAEERQSALCEIRERDPALAHEVESLLSVHQRREGFITAPIAVLPAESPRDSRENPDESSIGPYRLLEVIGEGGMGQVWRAEQTSPVRRTVALKLIRSGMDTY